LIKEKRAKAVTEAQKLFSQIRLANNETDLTDVVNKKIITICDELVCSSVFSLSTSWMASNPKYLCLSVAHSAHNF